MLRKRNSPGIEINEIDRSQYNNIQDYSLPNAPVCLITGFADKGENYKTQWINSKNTFIEKYGYPTNTAEQYFFNASMEILNRNGILLTNKFPYKNEAKDKFSYIEYNISDPISILDNENKRIYEKILDIKTNLMHLLNDLNIDYVESNIDSIKKILETINNLCENNNILKLDDKAKIQDLYKKIENLYELLTKSSDKFYQIYVNDSALTSYVRIDLNETKTEDNLMNLDTLDKFITSTYNATNTNKITIVDIQQNKYEKSNLPYSKIVHYDNEVENCPFLGIVPVIVSPANALYYQKLLSDKNGNYTKLVDFRNYNIISEFKVRKNKKINQETFKESYFTVPLASTCSIFDENEYDNSLSKQLAKYFPTITYNSNNTFDKEHMKKIGIVVLKAYNDTANNNTINFEVIESFVGSLNKNAKNPITNANEFIDNIVNSQSQYINVFTAVEDELLNKASFVATNNQNIMSLGFHRHECKKIIDYTESIIQPMNKMFGVLNNTTTSNIDIVVDAGMTNIAQYLTNSEKENMSFDNNIETLTLNSISKWYTVTKMFDEFCKFTRKDCMFLNDIPRPFCLEGENKIVRHTNPSNTIENSILSKLKKIKNINSSYSAGYCDWFYCKDGYTGNFFWCPPSIKAAGIFCYTDIYFHKWDAPAGMNRGIVQGTYDVAFSPNDDEAGRIYQQAWNYAINYPINGIVLEGQKTFQRNATALDRINVRRLLLYLEKRTAQIAKQFLYEGNTSYLRMKLVDSLAPIFEDAKNGNGIIDYIIKCDETNNTPVTIDRNELHVAIAVKPVKTVEYIIVNFIVTNQSANVSEEVRRI